MHTSAQTRAARSATEPPRRKRSAKLREPCKDHSAHTWQTETLARWRSIIPRTRKPAETRARWQSIASMRSHAPLPPTEPRQGCERTAQRSPSQARVPTSTTHERKRVCRWEARAWPQLDNVTLRDVSNAHVQGGRRHYQQSESGAGKRTGLTQLKTERAKDLPHGGVDGSMLPNQRPGDARSGLRREKSSDNTQA